MPATKRISRPDPAQGFRRLLVAADGTEPALRAVDVAAEMAARYRAELHVILILDVSPATDPEFAAEVVALEASVERQRAERSRWIVDVAVAHQVEPEIHVLPAHSVQAVVDFARDQAIDLILVDGVRHAKLFDAVFADIHEALLGSRAGHLVHLAPCTVMVVK